MLKTNFYTILCFLLISSSVDTIAQSNIPGSYPVDYITQFQDIHVDAAGMGYVVGKCGVVRKTENDGQNWTTVDSPTEIDIKTTACAPSGCGKVLIATDLKMYLSNNGTWVDVTYPDYSQAGQLHWLSDQVVIHETTGMEYYRSTDGGMTWSSVPLTDFQRGNMALIDDQNGYVFAQSDLYKTTDQWASINAVGYTHPASIREMAWLDDNKGWLFDGDRFFYATTDGGQSWNLLNDTSQLSSVNWFVPLSETHLVGAQVPSQKIESTDGGVTWTRGSFKADGNKSVNGKFHRKGDAFFLVGNQNQLLYSETGFTDFYELDPFDRQERIQSIAFASDDVGYAVTRDELKVTKDGGDSWSSQDILMSFPDMEILNNGALVLVATNGSLISTDQGATLTDWLPDALTPDGENPYRMTIKPDGNPYLLSSNYGYQSSDGGTTFTAINTAHDFSPTDVFFLDENNGYAVGRSKQFMTTSDGGQTWTKLETVLWNNMVDVYFFDENNGWISAGRSRYTTSDRGQTWTSIGSTGGYDMAYNSGDGSVLSARFGSGNTGELGRSKDNGETWDIIGFTCFPYRCAALTPSNKFFFTGGDGFIVRHDLAALTTSTKNDVRRKDISNLVAYPNPVSDVLTIEIPDSDARSIVRIFNTNGVEVRQIISEAGENIVTQSMSDFTTGMYFVQWQSRTQLGQALVIKN